MTPKLTELSPEARRRVCDPGGFDFDTTARLPALAEVLGQPRAVAALEFGSGIPSPGFNLFVLGAPMPQRLPPGRGTELRRDIDALLEELRAAILRAFDTGEYSTHRDKVSEAVRERKFHIWTADSVDAALELLTGLARGEPDVAGVHPEGSVHRPVGDRLGRYAALGGEAS